AAAPGRRKAKPASDERVVAALRKLGAKIKRDKTQAGTPVIGVEFIGDASDAAVEMLASLPSLRRGSLHGPVTDAGLASLRDSVRLEVLSICGTAKVTDAGLKHLAKLSALEHLHVDNCASITDEGLPALRGLKRLQTLDLYDGRF